jgi:hypothetical protein
VGIAIPWVILMATQAYRHGIATTPPQMPEPYWFFWGSAAMGLAGVVAMANHRLGVVLAWGFMLGALVYNYETNKTQAAQTTANTNPSALAVKTTTQ